MEGICITQNPPVPLKTPSRNHPEQCFMKYLSHGSAKLTHIIVPLFSILLLISKRYKKEAGKRIKVTDERVARDEGELLIPF